MSDALYEKNLYQAQGDSEDEGLDLQTVDARVAAATVALADIDKYDVRDSKNAGD